MVFAVSESVVVEMSCNCRASLKFPGSQHFIFRLFAAGQESGLHHNVTKAWTQGASVEFAASIQLDLFTF